MADETTNDGPIPEKEWKLITERIIEGHCVPFLGAGASVSAGLPSGRQLADRAAKVCDYPGPDSSDFLRVFQYFAMSKDKTAPRNFLAKEFAPYETPGVIHTTIASMPFQYVLTTNFDQLMETAFRQEDKVPTVLTYQRRGNVFKEFGDVDAQHPVVYKLHGSIDKTASMVVTEDDVVDFLACVTTRDPELPPKIQALFAEQSVVFIGYALKDWNVRVLLRALRGQEPASMCFAVQKRPDNHEAKEWEETVMHLRRGLLHCYEVDAVWFVEELKRRYDKRLKELTASASAEFAGTLV